MTKQEKHKTLQTLDEISLLLDEAVEKYINDLPAEARIKYADVFSHIGRAEDGLINVAYELKLMEQVLWLDTHYKFNYLA